MSNGTLQTGQQEGAFWDALKKHFKTKGIPLKLGNHNNRNYFRIALGRTGFSLNFAINTLKNWLRCEIYINGENSNNDFSRL